MTKCQRHSPTGKYVSVAIREADVEAFIPAPLPPSPPIRFEGPLLDALDAATLAVGKLDGAIEHLPNKSLLVYPFVRKEAVLSSQIEGTQSSLTDLMRHELGETPGCRSKTWAKYRPTSPRANTPQPS